MIVDTHCHASPYWFEPVEALLFQMERNDVAKAALVQFRGNSDNWYLMECVRRFPGRFVAVVIVDTDRPDAPAILAAWAKEGAQAVRFLPTTRSPGHDPLAIWRKASELGLLVSCLGTGEEFASDDFRRVVEELPGLSIIIEHLGSFPYRDERPPYPVFRKILALARYPNTYIKVGGLGEICHRPFPFRQPMPFATVPPFVEMAYNAFGPRRMMWGSDFPPVSSREGYRNALQWLQEHMSFCSEQDREWVFGKTALSLFRFNEAASS